MLIATRKRASSEESIPGESNESPSFDEAGKPEKEQ
ncbi:unnamed protein product, partial [Allacma fusca]